jgi:succinyl-CoA synthetase alpha subunit
MTTDGVQARVLRDTYRDSVELMRVAAQVERLPGVRRAALLVATPANLELLAGADLLSATAARARPTDLVIAVAADSEAAGRAALDLATALLTAPTPGAPAPGASLAASIERPRTLAAALQQLPEANLAIVSTPGSYATAEALKALKRGLDVFLFSDNVPIEDEIELKRLASRKGRLLMGPDCGTAILDGVPLGFANAVRRGRVGFVAASGTGLQAVTCLVDRLGEGISQAIGTGGRDLDDRVGGLTMLAGLDRLLADPDTAVIGLVSKRPSAEVARRVLARAVGAGRAKPVVACFLGEDATAIRALGAVPAATLDEAARLAVELARGGVSAPGGAPADMGALRGAARRAAAGLASGQRAIRGLFSGGTLCGEARLIVAETLAGHATSAAHALIDLGEDEFTRGRPHPMIDVRLRQEHVLAAAEDAETAVILLDVVLGWGSHPDPAEALALVLDEARRRAAQAGRTLVVIASVCGTESDPQGLHRQEARLGAAGVLCLPSNAEAARLAGLVVLEAGRD